MRGIWNSNDTYLSPRILRALPTTEARPRDCSSNGGDPTVLPMFHRIWGEYDQRCKIVTLLGGATNESFPRETITLDCHTALDDAIRNHLTVASQMFLHELMLQKWGATGICGDCVEVLPSWSKILLTMRLNTENRWRRP